MDSWIIITIIMNGISFILNGLFLFVLAWNKDLVKRKRITYHLANIAVADTLYGLGSFCFFIVRNGNEVTYEKLLPFIMMSNVGYLASQAAVFLMTIERSIVISAAVNIYMFKKLRKKDGLAHNQLSTAMVPQANAQQKSIHLKRKASKLVLLLAIIMIVTCSPNSLLSMIMNVCYGYNLHCNLYVNVTAIRYVTFTVQQNLNFLVNPLVYIWKDRIFRNAFYRTFNIKTQS